MVDLVTFNELSLPFKKYDNLDEQFKSFFLLLDKLKENNLKKLRTIENFKNYKVTENLSFQQYFNQIRDKEFQRKVISFMNSGFVTIDSPLIKDEDFLQQDMILENQYFYDEQINATGLACADIWNTLLISFNSSQKWDTPFINLQKETISLHDTIQSSKIIIKHSSKIEHLENHKVFFEEIEKENQLSINPDSFYENRTELFKNKIILCSEIKEQIKSLDIRVFRKVLSLLRDIDTNKKSLNDFTISGEGQTVKRNPKLKAMKTFYINQKEEFFEKHIKGFFSGYRVHYLEKNKKIYIGYIGKHLSNKSNK